jgi:hypothetical protein
VNQRHAELTQNDRVNFHKVLPDIVALLVSRQLFAG